MKFTRREIEISGGRRLYLYEFADHELGAEADGDSNPSAVEEAPKGNLEPEDSERK